MVWGGEGAVVFRENEWCGVVNVVWCGLRMSGVGLTFIRKYYLTRIEIKINNIQILYIFTDELIPMRRNLQTSFQISWFHTV